MKVITLSALLITVLPLLVNGQNVGISDNDSTFTPDNSAALEIKSTSRGVLVPRLTTAQKNAVASPAEGLLVYDTDLDFFFYYTTGWQQLGGVSGSAGTSLNDTDADTKVEVEKTADEDKIRMTTAGIERISINDTGKIIIGSAADHTYFIKDGSLRMEGAATTFTDLNVPVNATTRGGTKDPDLNRLLRDAGNTSQGVFAFDFDKSTEEELYFMVQMPHSWKVGSTIYPHVHWTANNNVGSDVVRWGMEYSWSNVGSSFGNTTIIYGETPIAAASPVTSLMHTITPLGGITASGKTLSSALVCRIFRDADHTNDDFDYDAVMLMIDFHFEEDSFGSRTEFTK
jgi:hypothetical protein